MLNSITAHIKFIHGNHIFGEIIPYRIIYPKLPLYRFFRCKQIGHLNVEFLPSLITDKIYFLILIFADRNMISAAEQFQIYNVFKRQINILCISSKRCWNFDFLTGLLLASSICFSNFWSSTNFRIIQVCKMVISVAMK